MQSHACLLDKNTAAAAAAVQHHNGHELIMHSRVQQAEPQGRTCAPCSVRCAGSVTAAASRRRSSAQTAPERSLQHWPELSGHPPAGSRQRQRQQQ
jgi:hypothetical protein